MFGLLATAARYVMHWISSTYNHVREPAAVWEIMKLQVKRHTCCPKLPGPRTRSGQHLVAAVLQQSNLRFAKQQSGLDSKPRSTMSLGPSLVKRKIKSAASWTLVYNVLV